MVVQAATWEAHHTPILNWAEHGYGTATIIARAGGGKTTIIMEALTRAPEQSILLAAFNKSVEKELIGRVQARGLSNRVTVKTAHAFGMGLIRKHWPEAKKDERRPLQLARAALSKQSQRYRDLDSAVQRLKKSVAAKELGEREGKDAEEPYAKEMASMAEATEALAAWIKKTLLWVPGQRLVRTDVQDLMRTYDVTCSPQHVGDVIQAAHVAVELSTVDNKTFCFEDMVYVPVALGWHQKENYDMLVIDEAQDLNKCTSTLLNGAVTALQGRRLVVGDDRQAIYQFNGADPKILDQEVAHADFNFSLPRSHRCRHAITAHVNSIVPDIRATRSGGSIIAISRPEMFRRAAPGDFIISRKNAPMVSVYLELRKWGKPAYVLKRPGVGGHTITRRIKEFSKKGAYGDLGKMLAEGEAWVQSKIDSGAPLGVIEDARDILATIKALVVDVLETRYRCAKCQRAMIKRSRDPLASNAEPRSCDVVERAGQLFGEGKRNKNADGVRVDAITLSTVHRIKGFEARRVFILTDTFAHRDLLDDNLAYVAVTRAKDVVYLVSTRSLTYPWEGSRAAYDDPYADLR